MTFIGEIAGLLTSFFFAANAVFITQAGQQVGSIITNRVRVVFALIYLVILNTLLYRQPLPLNAGLQHWTWLSLSGLIGLAIGDSFLIQAYLYIGPRLGTLLLSLSTVFGVLEAWVFLREQLQPGQLLGIGLTLAGIVWVVLEQSNGRDPAQRPSVLGVIFGILGALGQATGLVFSRLGMLGSFSPISGNVIRMLTAVAALWLVTFLQGATGKTVRTLQAHPGAFRLLALVALLGPVIGVSLSLLAVQNTEVGVASVLTSLSPIFILPFSHFYLKERLGWQAVVGTLVAMAGVTILFLV